MSFKYIMELNSNMKNYMLEVLFANTFKRYDIFENGIILCSVVEETTSFDLLKEEVSYYGDLNLYKQLKYATTFVEQELKGKSETVFPLFKESAFYGIRGLQKEVYPNNTIRYKDHSGVIALEFSVDAPLHVRTSNLKFEKVDEKKARKFLPFSYKTAIMNGLTEGANRFVQYKTIDQLKIEKDLAYLQNKKYEVVDTTAKLDLLLSRLQISYEKQQIVAWDAETTGVVFNHFPEGYVCEFTGRERSTLVGICIATDEDAAYYIPLESRNPSVVPLDKIETLRQLKFYMENCIGTTHFGYFDWQVFWSFGINMNIVHDSYVLKKLISKVPFASAKLKDLLEITYNVESIDLTDFFYGGKSQVTFDMLGYGEVQAYGGQDGDFTLKLTKDLLNILYTEFPQMSFLYGVEINLIKAIAIQEFYGKRLNFDKIHPLKHKYLDILEESTEVANKIINELADTPKNYFVELSSDQQKAEALYTYLKLPILEKTDNGEPSTSGETLKYLIKHKDVKDNPKLILMLKAMMDYSEYSQKVSLFLEKFENERMGDYINPRYLAFGTATGRLSGRNPNLQQMDNALKHLVLAWSDDYEFVCADYSQIELRVMSSLGRAKHLVKAFQDKLGDFHITMASLIHNIPTSEVTSELRSASKSLNFGIPYGISPHTLRLWLGGISLEEAKNIMTAYFDAVPEIKLLLDEVRENSLINGFTETLLYRRRYYTEDSIIHQQSMVERQSGNTAIQGTAADILKYALVRVQKALEANFKGYYYDEILTTPPPPPEVFLSANVHDELHLDKHKDVPIWKVFKIAKEAMEFDIILKDGFEFAPIDAGIGVGETWKQAKAGIMELPGFMTEQYFVEMDEGKHLESYGLNSTKIVYNQIQDFQAQFVVELLKKEGYDLNLPLNINELFKLILNDWRISRLLDKYCEYCYNPDESKITKASDYKGIKALSMDENVRLKFIYLLSRIYKLSDLIIDLSINPDQLKGKKAELYVELTSDIKLKNKLDIEEYEITIDKLNIINQVPFANEIKSYIGKGTAIIILKNLKENTMERIENCGGVDEVQLQSILDNRQTKNVISFKKAGGFYN